MSPLPKRCLGVPGGDRCRAWARPGKPRCVACTRALDRARWAKKATTYDSAWKSESARRRAEHLETFGAVCPGYRRRAHAVLPSELVVDHDLGVLCARCNSRKAATVDKGLPPPPFLNE